MKKGLWFATYFCKLYDISMHNFPESRILAKLLTKWFLLLPTKQWPCLLYSLEGCKAAATSGGSASFRDIGKPEPAVLWFLFSCLHPGTVTTTRRGATQARRPFFNVGEGLRARSFKWQKTRQKLHKKICEIVWVTLMLATIWQVSEMQCMQSPETMQICWNRFWKNRESTSGELILGRF